MFRKEKQNMYIKQSLIWVIYKNIIDNDSCHTIKFFFRRSLCDGVYMIVIFNEKSSIRLIL